MLLSLYSFTACAIFAVAQENLALEPVHWSTAPPTGLALDLEKNVYITYPRNQGPTTDNVVICTGYTEEKPWPNAQIQNYHAGLDASKVFVNVQNVVLDSKGVLWLIDSGIPAGEKEPVPGGAKLMAYKQNGELIRTYVVPTNLLHDELNLNDVRINNTLGTGGWAFIADESTLSSLVVIDLHDGSVQRRLFNTSVVTAEPNYVGSYLGEPIYSWNKTTKSYIQTGADGVALASGQFYWGVFASRRFYFISQEVLIDKHLTDEQVLAQVQIPGQCGSEQAGFTADDQGRVYILASEQNAIYYVDTVKHGTGYGAGSDLIPAADQVVKSLVHNATAIQHADSAAILDGYLYFTNNQLALSPGRQYNNVDHRKGPFPTYRVYIGRGPAPA